VLDKQFPELWTAFLNYAKSLWTAFLNYANCEFSVFCNMNDTGYMQELYIFGLSMRFGFAHAIVKFS
jgi:hypothetical protein